MPDPSIFSDEWRNCQREHYKQIVRSGSAQRRAEVADALRSLGFSESELSELYLAATMRADDMPDDFLPDLDVLEAERQQRDLQPHPDECMCPSCVPPIQIDHH